MIDIEFCDGDEIVFDLDAGACREIAESRHQDVVLAACRAYFRNAIVVSHSPVWVHDNERVPDGRLLLAVDGPDGDFTIRRTNNANTQRDRSCRMRQLHTHAGNRRLPMMMAGFARGFDFDLRNIERFGARPILAAEFQRIDDQPLLVDKTEIPASQIATLRAAHAKRKFEALACDNRSRHIPSRELHRMRLDVAYSVGRHLLSRFFGDTAAGDIAVTKRPAQPVLVAAATRLAAGIKTGNNRTLHVEDLRLAVDAQAAV